MLIELDTTHLALRREYRKMTVIPIYNLLLVPDANIYLKSDQYRHLARRYAEVNDRVVLLA